MNEPDPIAAALEHARLVRAILDQQRKDARTEFAREIAISLEVELENLARGA